MQYISDYVVNCLQILYLWIVETTAEDGDFNADGL